MKNVKVVRRCITLIEIMIVMFLITLISGVVAFNVKGILDRGKAFKTYEAMQKIQSILVLKESMQPGALDHVEENWKEYIKESPLAGNVKNLVKDGWGQEYQISLEQSRLGGRHILIYSSAFETYKDSHPDMFPDDKDV